MVDWVNFGGVAAAALSAIATAGAWLAACQANKTARGATRTGILMELTNIRYSQEIGTGKRLLQAWCDQWESERTTPDSRTFAQAFVQLRKREDSSVQDLDPYRRKIFMYYRRIHDFRKLMGLLEDKDIAGLLNGSDLDYFRDIVVPIEDALSREVNQHPLDQDFIAFFEGLRGKI